VSPPANGFIIFPVAGNGGGIDLGGSTILFVQPDALYLRQHVIAALFIS
jgi:hypothetical protein